MLLIFEVRECLIKYLNIIDRCNLSQISKAVYTSCRGDPYRIREIDLTGDRRLRGKNLYLYMRKLGIRTTNNIRLLALHGTLADSRDVEDVIDKCENIRILKLGEQQLSKRVIVSVSKKLLLLKELWVINACFINIHTIRVIAKFLKNIEGLFLPNSKRLDDKGLMVISQKMINLQRLSLRGCDSITDLGLQHVVLRCKSLEYLDVSMTRTMAYPTCIWIAKIARNLTKIVVSNTRIYNCGSRVLQMKFRERGLDPEKSVVLCKTCNEYCPTPIHFSEKHMIEHTQTHFQEPAILTEYKQRRANLQ